MYNINDMHDHGHWKWKESTKLHLACMINIIDPYMYKNGIRCLKLGFEKEKFDKKTETWSVYFEWGRGWLHKI